MHTNLIIKLNLKENLKNVTHLSYKDHHRYAEADVKKIKSTFDNMSAENKFIITTEKDAGRLLSENLRDLTLNLPIFFISQHRLSNHRLHPIHHHYHYCLQV